MDGEGVRVFTTALGAGADPVVLDADERRQAARRAAGSVRARFVARRVRLREILGTLLALPPAAVEIVPAAGGKPHVPGAPFHFNASSSGDRLVVAVAPCEVGVDVEDAARPLGDLPGMLAHCLSPDEQAHVAACRPAHPARIFYRAWTAKEACLKAAGLGLRVAPAAVDVLDADLGLRARAAVQGRTWHLRAVDLGPGAVAAVATAEPCDEVAVHRWPTSSAAP